jgi:hypothetical protein
LATLPARYDERFLTVVISGLGDDRERERVGTRTVKKKKKKNYEREREAERTCLIKPTQEAKE